MNTQQSQRKTWLCKFFLWFSMFHTKLLLSFFYFFFISLPTVKYYKHSYISSWCDTASFCFVKPRIVFRLSFFLTIALNDFILLLFCNFFFLFIFLKINIKSPFIVFLFLIPFLVQFMCAHMHVHRIEENKRIWWWWWRTNKHPSFVSSPFFSIVINIHSLHT